MTLTFRCQKCGAEVERKATPGERAILKDDDFWSLRPALHKVWHEFQRRFYTPKTPREYRWKGYDLMLRVEKWAEKYPEDVRIVRIDDAAFAGSILVLVEHRTPLKYMGTTAVCIPQCTGEDPLEFFLYPDDRDGLLKALLAIQAASRPIAIRQRKAEIERALQTKKFIRHPAVV